MKKISQYISRIKKFSKDLGPGLITGASDDDPSGIVTYSQAGAQFGTSMLWTALLTFPLMTSIQEMCARIAIITSKGLMTNIEKQYSRFFTYLILILTFPAIVLNIGADIAGMGAVANLLLPSIPSYIFAIAFTGILLLLIIYLSYQTMAKFLKYLCLSLLLYLIVPFLVKQNWPQVFQHTFIPHIKFNKEFIGLLVAILGTTISPYMFFWQATMEAEEMTHKKSVKNPDFLIRKMRQDVTTGMLSSNVVMYFIILTTGTILFQNGIHHIETVQQAAKALEPLAGKFCYLIFAAGIIGTGFLAIPVLCASISYIFAATFNWKGGLDKKLHQAKLFYLIIFVSLLLGLALDLSGISPVKVLVYTAMLYGITAPVLLVIILLIANNKKIMGKHVNGMLSNILGIVTLLLMSAAALLLLFQI